MSPKVELFRMSSRTWQQAVCIPDWWPPAQRQSSMRYSGKRPFRHFCISIASASVPGRLLYTCLRHSHPTSILRSAGRHHLTVPCYRLSTFGRQTFSVAGPTAWNSLPDSLRDPAITSNSFRQSLLQLSTHRTVEMLHVHHSAPYKSIIGIDSAILYCMHWQTGNQCRHFSTAVMWSECTGYQMSSGILYWL